MHQAGQICRNHILRSLFQRIIDLLLSHSRRNGIKFYRESTAKTTAHIGIFHFHHFQSMNLRQQLSWFRFNLTFPQATAGIMINCLAIQFSTKIISFQHIDQEIRQLKYVRLNISAFIVYNGIGKQVTKPILHHPNTRGRRRYNIIRFRKII
ncbi:hypothetical protein D3C86_1816700 [compost metagenome]